MAQPKQQIARTINSRSNWQAIAAMEGYCASKNTFPRYQMIERNASTLPPGRILDS